MNIDHFFDHVGVGENLEDQAAFYELDRLLQGKPEVVSGSTMICAAEPPAWAQALDLAEKLLLESKDIRIAVGLTRCLIALEGLQGLTDGFVLLARILDEYWEAVYPVPYEDEPDNFMDRINALAVLNDYAATIFYIRNVRLLKSKKSLVLTPRMFCIAGGKLSPRDDEQAWTLEQLRLAVSEAEVSDVEVIRQSLGSLQDSIRKIKRTFQERAGGDCPDLKNLEADLAFLRSFFESSPEIATTAVTGGDADAQPVLMAAASPAFVSGSPLAPRPIQSRQDVVAMLEKLCHFMEEHEPAHPAPLFMRRAQRLLSMNFMEIVRDLTPDAFDAMSHYKGRDPNDDDY